jgi:hypothetical protein
VLLWKKKRPVEKVNGEYDYEWKGMSISPKDRFGG